jgi:chemotaxis protein MotA
VERNTLIGITASILLLVLGFVINGSIGLYFNLVSMLIVIGGVFGAAFISFRWERLAIVYRVLRSLYRTKIRTPEEIVETLVDLSVKSKINGILSLQNDQEETSINFLKRSLGLLVDGFPREQIREILTTEMYFFKLRRQESERVLRTIAEVCPPFGLIGSIVGLLGLFSAGYDDASILRAIATALTATVYGAVLAYFLFIPFAAHIRERTDNELLLQKIILEGVIAIESELKPRMLELKLKSFLTPSSRAGSIVSLERIRERFKVKEEEDKLPSIKKRPLAKS